MLEYLSGLQCAAITHNLKRSDTHKSILKLHTKFDFGRMADKNGHRIYVFRFFFVSFRKCQSRHIRIRQRRGELSDVTNRPRPSDTVAINFNLHRDAHTRHTPNHSNYNEPLIWRFAALSAIASFKLTHRMQSQFIIVRAPENGTREVRMRAAKK